MYFSLLIIHNIINKIKSVFRIIFGENVKRGIIVKKRVVRFLAFCMATAMLLGTAACGGNDISKETLANSNAGEGKVFTEADLQNVGYYYRMFKAYFADSSDNKGYFTASVYVYDPNNTVAPTITTNAEAYKIALEADVNAITGVGEGCPVVSAVDADGLDVSANVVADLSTLDSTTPGTYDVKITVTDFAGNTAEATVQVVVE